VFEDLCAFFTADPARLIVGLISTDGEPPPNVHHPRITIKQGGQTIREYTGFEQINGFIYLNLLPSGPPLTRYVSTSPTDPRQSFDLLVVIDQQLYPKGTITHDILGCRAMLQFKSGTLYTMGPIPVRFVDEKTGDPNNNAPTQSALKVGIDAEIPASGYAVLHFTNSTEDFVFKGDQDFDVEVINAADNKQLNHFKYLYNIVQPTPDPKWIPTAPPPGSEPRPRNIDQNCLGGGYGDPPPPPPPPPEDPDP
jgi:hypothetical protein